MGKGQFLVLGLSLSVVLLASMTAPARADDGDPFVIAAGGSALDVASAEGSTLETFEAEDGKIAMRWTSDGKEAALLSIYRMPADLRPYRTLRLRLRGARRPSQRIYVRLSTDDGGLEDVLTAAASAADWTEVEIPLPRLPMRGDVDPEKVQWFQLVAYEPGPFTLEISGIRLEKAPGGWRWTPEEEKARADAPVFRVADFEGTDVLFSAIQSTAEVVADGDGRVLRWTQPKRPDGGWLNVLGIPADITGYRILRFRARAVEGEPVGVDVRIRSDDGYLDAPLPKLGKEWTPVEILLPELPPVDDFDPKKVFFLRLVCFSSEGFTLDVDDFELHREGAGWRYSAEERREMGIDTTAPEYRIADFEREGAMSRATAWRVRLARVREEGRKKSGNHVLRLAVEKDGEDVGFRLIQVPGDISDYRLLRFRARADGKVSDDILLGFESEEGDLCRALEDLDRRWKDFEIPLPSMEAREGFDPGKVTDFFLAIYGAKKCVYEFDDFVLVKGAGGWKRSKEEQLAHVFGEDRARKVREIDTDHFEIWTDSAAAVRKFPKALEKTYEFVCEALGLSGFEGKLPVYIFQSSNLYQDFCVRSGWSREFAEQTAGHADKSYFATYYQAPDAATVTHELTHAIFNRAVGDGGGSWFQEGVAVYVEELWQERSAAETFAPRLRSGQFISLPEFVGVDTLAGEDDVKGGARTAGSLYAQAGAFFEYLFRGPPAESRPGAIRALAVLDEDDDGYVEEVVRILGAPLAEIEKGWRAWGEDPPEPRRR